MGGGDGGGEVMKRRGGRTATFVSADGRQATRQTLARGGFPPSVWWGWVGAGGGVAGDGLEWEHLGARLSAIVVLLGLGTSIVLDEMIVGRWLARFMISSARLG
jgi:hypothetical protein